MPSFQKIIFHVLLLSVTLSFTQHSYASNSDAYNSALKLYNNKQYELAYQAFSRIVEQNYSAQNANFYLARSATITKRIDEAIITYERILILDPNNTRSKLELGRLHFEQASYALAESYFKAALQDNVPQQVEENIQQFLAALKKQNNKSSLTGVLIAGIGYDTNINSAASASSWYVPIFDLEFDNATDTLESAFHQETAVINHYYDGTDTLGFGIKNTLLAYSKAYTDEGSQNILYGKYSPALVFTGKHHRLETAAELSYMNYGGDAYLKSYGISPKLTYKKQQDESVSLQAKALKKDYLQKEKQDRDSLYTEIAMKYQKLSGSKLAWNLNSAIQTESKNSGDLYDVDYKNVVLEAGTTYQVYPDLTVGTAVKIEQKNYQDESPFFLDRRVDKKRKLSVNVTKKLSKKLSLQTLMEHTVNQSNQEPYEYTKSAIAINLIQRF